MIRVGKVLSRLQASVPRSLIARYSAAAALPQPETNPDILYTGVSVSKTDIYRFKNIFSIEG